MTKQIDAIISTDDAAEIERARPRFRRKMSAKAYIAMAINEKASRDHPGFGCASYLSVRSVHGTKFAWDEATANAAHASHDPEACDRTASEPIHGLTPGSILQYGRPLDFETVGSDIGNMTVLILALSGERNGIRAAQVCPVYGNPFSDTVRARPGEVEITIPRNEDEGEGSGTPAIAYPRDIRHCLVDRTSFAFGADRALSVGDADLTAVIAMRDWITADDQDFKSSGHGYGHLHVKTEDGASMKVHINPKTSYALSKWRASTDAFVTAAIRERLAIDLVEPTVWTTEGILTGQAAREALDNLAELTADQKLPPTKETRH